MTTPTDHTGAEPADRPPPGTDVSDHLRRVAHHALPALALALLVALVVGVVRASSPPVYQAQATAVVQPGGLPNPTAAPTSDDVSRVTAAVTAAASDPAVLLAASAGTGWSARQAAANTSVGSGDAPGVVTFTVRAPSAAEARSVASALPTAVQASVRARQAQLDDARVQALMAQQQAVRARLEGLTAGTPEYQRVADDAAVRAQQISSILRADPVTLQVPAAPVVSPGPVAPHPLRDAALAFLLTALVAAELLALLAGRWGQRVTRAAADRLVRRGDRLHVLARDRSTDARALPLRAAVAHTLGAGQQVAVLAAPTVARAEAASLVAPGPAGVGRGSTRIAVLALDGPWYEATDAARVGLAVLVLPLGAPVRARAAQAAHALAAAGADVHVVLLVSPHGIVPLPPAARARALVARSRPVAARAVRIAGVRRPGQASTPAPPQDQQPDQRPDQQPDPQVTPVPTPRR